MEQHIKQEFDILIIGAGISGLMSAAIFSRFGYSVCVLEMDARPGGYIAGFNRLDFRFDSAIHWLNQCGESGLVTQAFKFIGHDYPKVSSQKLIKRMLINNQNFLITTDTEAYKKQLQETFPEDKKGIERFFKDAYRIAKSFKNFQYINRNMATMNFPDKIKRGLQMMRFVVPFIPHIFYGGDQVKKGLKKYFSNPKLLDLFSAEPDLLSCLIPIAWASLGDYQKPPVGGSQTFAEWLEHVVLSYGNEIRFKSKVEKIRLKQGKAVGIEYNHRNNVEFISGKYIIAACDVKNLYEKYLPKSISNPDFLKQLDDAELYASAFTISLALDCTAESLGFGEEMIFISDANKNREALGNGDPHTSGIHLLSGSIKDSSMAPIGKGTLTIFIPSFIDQYDNWGVSKDENGNFKRNETYKEKKQEVASILIQRIEKKMNINLTDHILYLDIATPITHQRYTGNRNGTMMGARPGKANMKAKIAHYKTPVSNVFLSGHWAELGGGIPVAIRASMNSSLLVLKQLNQKAFRLLANYMDGKIVPEQLNSNKLLKPYSENWKRKPTPAEKKALKNQS